MRKIFFIAISTFLFFIFEFIFFNLFGRWLKPGLLVLLVVYFNLAFGVRYSLLAALFAGILKDSFGIHPFGLNIFSLILCAYLTTFIKRYLFHMGSSISRTLIVFIVTSLNVFVLYVFNAMMGEMDLVPTFIFVLLPEVLTTSLIASFVFFQLKKCVLRLSVHRL